uniref:hypothetical protein n=1 Tax=Flavobacterium sp. TaxID=239 RepID=UPI004049D44F
MKIKKRYLIILSATLISCNPFSANRVLNYEDELFDLVSRLENHHSGTYKIDELHEDLQDGANDLNIDFIVKNKETKNPKFSGFMEENDSLIIFVKKAKHIFDFEQRIIYDFSKSPRNFGSDDLILASYKSTQLNERWYFTEIGFD